MIKDSKEKILSDWNASGEWRTFNHFKDLFDYLEGMSKEMGKQSKKEIYQHPSLPSNKFSGAREALLRKAKLQGKVTSVRVAEFRQRVKLLSRAKNT